MPVQKRKKPTVKGKDAERFIKKALKNQKKLTKQNNAELFNVVALKN